MYGVYCITRARCLTAHPVLGLTELKSKAPSFVLFQRSASTACSLLIVLVALLMSRPVEWDSGRAHEESQECPMPLRTGESSVTSQKCPVMPCLTGSSVPLRILEGLQNYIKLGWSINVYWGLSCFIWAHRRHLLNEGLQKSLPFKSVSGVPWKTVPDFSFQIGSGYRVIFFT